MGQFYSLSLGKFSLVSKRAPPSQSEKIRHLDQGELREGLKGYHRKSKIYSSTYVTISTVIIIPDKMYKQGLYCMWKTNILTVVLEQSLVSHRLKITPKLTLLTRRLSWKTVT